MKLELNPTLERDDLAGMRGPYADLRAFLHHRGSISLPHPVHGYMGDTTAYERLSEEAKDYWPNASCIVTPLVKARSAELTEVPEAA